MKEYIGHIFTLVAGAIGYGIIQQKVNGLEKTSDGFCKTNEKIDERFDKLQEKIEAILISQSRIETFISNLECVKYRDCKTFKSIEGGDYNGLRK